jgi:hypothetical protein
MKCFTFFSVLVFATFGSVLRADDPTPADNAGMTPAEQPVTVEGQYMPAMVTGAYTDFPPYPPGYTSYRGLGFMGFCCEQYSCCSQYVWDGYCAGRGCGHCGHLQGWMGQIRCRQHNMMGCNVCGGQRGARQRNCPRKVQP